ncbi:MAG TPA: hypothetical protein DCS93_07270 [Microscillaceae bacterium]|nr:hypothetical protein [Microscillaceae bacterium]
MKFQELLAKTNLRRGELKPSFNTGETPTQQHFHTLIDGLYLAQDDTLYKDKHSGLGIIAATPIPTDNANFKGNVENTTGDVLLFYDNDNQEPAWAMSILEGFHLKNASDQAQLSILPDGKLGIGTTTPATQLDIKGDLTLGADYQGDGRAGVINFRRGTNNVPTATMGFTGGESEFQFKNHFGGGHYTFYTDVSGTFTEKMRIANDGNVGIGGRSPEYKLDLGNYINGAITNQVVLRVRNTIADNRSTGWGSAIEFYNNSNNITGIATQNEGGAKIISEASDFGWAHNLKFRVVKNNDHASQTGIDAMLIDRNGNVGIGTTTPATQLDVKGDLTLGADYQGDGRAGVINFRRGANNVPTANLGFTGDESEFRFNNYFGGSHYTFYTGISEKMRIANDGNVGIGRSNPAAKLDVGGSIAINGVVQVSSDARLKTNIQLIEVNAITKLTQLNGVTYQWRSDEFKDNDFSKETQIGFIAQELQQVYPELVSEDNEGYLSINYNGLIPILVEAVKDLNQQNQVLQASVANLEQRVFNTSQA